MWRRLYLLLVLVRLYFSLQPSYLHPDEAFQGPEVVASEVFGWPAHKTWEFTSSQPIRSVFPLWVAYGFPLTILKWIWEGLGYGEVPPRIAFYTLRILMFFLNFILQDWALHELLPQPRERTMAIVMVMSSYVTWTFQMHTFSNSIETLLVLWALVLAQRLRDHDERTMVDCCVGLSFLAVFGVFNRITFPAFLIVPGVQLLPKLLVRRMRIPIMLVSTLLFLAIAVTMDTEYYTGIRLRFRDIFHPTNAIFTPWNNIRYNLDVSNLAEHGLHPFWQHSLVNLPQLIGPAFPLLFNPQNLNTLVWSAITGTAILSCFRHQEPRFLLPTVSLLLSSVKVPRRLRRYWIGSWILFNIFGGVLFGIYHQGGVVPAQMWLAEQDLQNVGQIFWWKTYSPPRWLLNGGNEHVETIDLMGMKGDLMVDSILDTSSCARRGRTLLVAPSSATFLDLFVTSSNLARLEPLKTFQQHIGLDDLDFGDDGVWPTLTRVIGRRGLTIWEVHRDC